MKHTSQKNSQKLNELQMQIRILNFEYQQQYEKLKLIYNIKDSHFSYDYDYFDENDFEFDESVSMLYTQYENSINIQKAKYAALFLIAHHIAHRGKMLHPDTAIKKLKKYGIAGQSVIKTITRPVLPTIINSAPYIHHALFKNYGVILMDTNTYDYVLKKIDEHAWSQGNDFAHRAEKRLNKYENFAKKFHKSVIDKMKLTLQSDERPF